MVDLLNDDGIVIEEQGAVVLVRYSGLPGDAAFERHLDQLEALLARPGRAVTIYDIAGDARSTAIQRRRQSEWLRRNERAIERASAGTAFVLRSALARGALTAILWISPVPGEHCVVGTLEEANRWARARLARPVALSA